MQNPLIIANTKSYLSSAKHVYHIHDSVWQLLDKEKYSYYLALPSSMIYEVSKEKYKAFKVGGQNVDTMEDGAHTGGTTCAQLSSAGAEFVILGHSEVRARGDTDSAIAYKVAQALGFGLMTVLCIGENSREGNIEYSTGIEKNIKNSKIDNSDEKNRQIDKETYPVDYLDEIKSILTQNLSQIDRRSVDRLVIAYEPVWAIGAVRPASSDQTLEAVIVIRRTLVEMFGLENAKKIRIIYGGSVSDENIAQYVRESGVDGVLVGRASLESKRFANIVNSLYA